MRKTLLASLVLAAFPAAVWAQNGAVKGTVTGADGKALGGTSISVMRSVRADRAEILFQDIVKDDGSYAITGIPAGSYSVTAIYPGLKPDGKPGVKIAGDEAVILDFTLSAY